MYPFPTLAAIDALWPAGSWTYAVVMFIAILATVVGFLWVMQDWFFPGQKRNIKTNIYIIGLIGVALGGVLPFSKVINIMYPLAGFVGLFMAIGIVVRTIQGFKETNKVKSITEEQLKKQIESREGL